MRLPYIILFLHIVTLCGGAIAVFERQMYSVLTKPHLEASASSKEDVPASYRSRLGTTLNNRVAIPLSAAMRKGRNGIRAIAKSAHEFQIEYQIELKRLLKRTYRSMNKFGLLTGRYVRTVVRFSTDKLRRALQLLIVSTMKVIHSIQHRLDRNAKVLGVSVDIKTVASPSSTSEPSSTTPSASPTWLSLKRSNVPVVTTSSSSAGTRVPLTTKQRRSAVKSSSVTIKQLNDDKINTTTDVQTVPSPSLLGSLASTLVTGLFFVAGGVMIGSFWNDWWNIRGQASSKNPNFGAGRITDDETTMAVSPTGAVVVEQDIFYVEVDATTSIMNPITPEPIRY